MYNWWTEILNKQTELKWIRELLEGENYIFTWNRDSIVGAMGVLVGTLNFPTSEEIKSAIKLQYCISKHKVRARNAVQESKLLIVRSALRLGRWSRWCPDSRYRRTAIWIQWLRLLLARSEHASKQKALVHLVLNVFLRNTSYVHIYCTYNTVAISNTLLVLYGNMELTVRIRTQVCI